jgi:hypothetical protein
MGRLSTYTVHLYSVVKIQQSKLIDLSYRHWILIDKYNENIGLSLVVGIDYKAYTVVVVLINMKGIKNEN